MFIFYVPHPYKHYKSCVHLTHFDTKKNEPIAYFFFHLNWFQGFHLFLELTCVGDTYLSEWEYWYAPLVWQIDIASKLLSSSLWIKNLVLFHNE